MTYDLFDQILINMDFITTLGGPPFITCVSVCECAKGYQFELFHIKYTYFTKSCSSNFMYMYEGPLEHIYNICVFVLVSLDFMG